VPSSFSRTERQSLSAMSAATFLPTRCMRICVDRVGSWKSGRISVLSFNNITKVGLCHTHLIHDGLQRLSCQRCVASKPRKGINGRAT
jgi:hypothetical protein